MYNEDVWNIYHEPTSSKEKDALSDGNPETYSKSDNDFSNVDKDDDIQLSGRYKEGFTSHDKINKDNRVYHEHKYLKTCEHITATENKVIFISFTKKFMGKDMCRK